MSNTVTIGTPASNGDPFDGNSNGTYSPPESTSVMVYFWTSDPNGTSPEPNPDKTESATLNPDAGTWSATMDLTGISTTTGYLRAVNGTAVAFKSDLQVGGP